MGLKSSPKINSQYVLSHLDEAQIFAAYFGEFSLDKNYNSVFRDDRHASTGFYVNQNGKLIYNDLKTAEKLDCFAFVGKMYDLSYGHSILRVACDFGLVECKEGRKFDPSSITKAQLVSESIKQETKIEIVADEWTPSYVNFWNQFSITKDELILAGDVFPIKKLFVNDKLIPNYTRNVRFAFCLKYQDILYKKIYNPYANDKKFKWLSNIPLYLPFGASDILKPQSDTLIITKSAKDRLIFKKYFTDVLGLQNESAAAFRDVSIEYVKRKYKNIFINTDLDEQGTVAVKHFITKGLKPLMLPRILYDKEGIKDIADFVKLYGINRFEDFLKYKNLWI